MATEENRFVAELTEDEVTKLLENAAKSGTKYNKGSRNLREDPKANTNLCQCTNSFKLN